MASPVRITDVNDERLALYRVVREPKLLEEHQTFIAESREVVRRLLDGGRFEIRSLFCTPAVFEFLEPSLAAHPDVPVYLADKAFMKTVAGFPVHRGCLAAAVRPAPASLDALLENAEPDTRPRLIGLESVTDPDNIGGIFRSAMAFGYHGVVLSERSSDPLYRKSIRTSMAATLRLPYCNPDDWHGALRTLQRDGFEIIALSSETGAADIREVAPRMRDEPAILLLGNEGQGLDESTKALASHRVRIPMVEGFDSLNVTSAASIAMFMFGCG